MGSSAPRAIAIRPASSLLAAARNGDPMPGVPGLLRKLASRRCRGLPSVAFEGRRLPDFVQWKTTTAQDEDGCCIGLRVPAHAAKFPERGLQLVRAWTSSRPYSGADG